MDNVGYEGGREITPGAERPAGRHPARGPGLERPWRSELLSKACPSWSRDPAHRRADAAPQGLALSIQRQRGPDTHLGRRRLGGAPKPGCSPPMSSARDQVLEVPSRPGGLRPPGRHRHRAPGVKEPDIGVIVATTVVAWPAMLTSGARRPVEPLLDDTIQLRCKGRAAARAGTGPAPEPQPEPPPPPPPPGLELRASRASILDAAASSGPDGLADRRRSRSACSWAVATTSTPTTSPRLPKPDATIAVAPPAPADRRRPRQKVGARRVGEFRHQARPGGDARQGRDYARQATWRRSWSSAAPPRRQRGRNSSSQRSTIRW